MGIDNDNGQGRTCAVCDKPLFYSVGQKTPFCHDHEQEWFTSPELFDAGNARARFIDRRRKELGK